jgi:hypothetical protein
LHQGDRNFTCTETKLSKTNTRWSMSLIPDSKSHFQGTDRTLLYVTPLRVMRMSAQSFGLLRYEGETPFQEYQPRVRSERQWRSSRNRHTEVVSIAAGSGQLREGK